MLRKRLRISDLNEALESCPQAVVAELLGVDVKTVRNRIAAGDWPDRGQGRTDLFEALKVERQRARQGVVGIDAARLKRAQADKVERDNLVAAGDLVPLPDVQLAGSQVIVQLGGRLRALESRLTTTLGGVTTGPERRRRIRSETRAIQEQFAAGIRALADGFDPETVG